MKLRSTILWAVALIVLAFVNYAIYQKEDLIRDGEPLFVELGPRDPRSLIQGDYMALRYRIAEELETKSAVPIRGQLVVTRNPQGIAEFVRIYDGQTPLQPGELLLNYYMRYGQIDVGVNSFFFQEGTAAAYETARYGELRVDRSGTSVLVGLRGPNLEVLGAPLQ
jgi:uncharacterized membrane-anchored protein